MARRISKERKEAASRIRKQDSGSGPVCLKECDVKIGDFPGGRGDRLVVSIRIFNNHKFIDVRRWYRVKGTPEFGPRGEPLWGSYKPTKGVSVGTNPAVLRSIAQALTRGAEAMELEQANESPTSGEDSGGED